MGDPYYEPTIVVHDTPSLPFEVVCESGIYIYTTPVVEIKSAALWGKLWHITDIPRFVAALTIYGLTSHIPRNPYLNGKQVSNNKRLNHPTIIHLRNWNKF